MRPETEQPAASAETFHIGTGVMRIQIQIFFFSEPPLVLFLLSGLSSGFLEVEEEKELEDSSRASRPVEPRRRCASESSISSCSSLPGSTR